jgi:hypothetical protein
MAELAGKIAAVAPHCAGQSRRNDSDCAHDMNEQHQIRSGAIRQTPHCAGFLRDL